MGLSNKCSMDYVCGVLSTSKKYGIQQQDEEEIRNTHTIEGEREQASERRNQNVIRKVFEWKLHQFNCDSFNFSLKILSFAYFVFVMCGTLDGCLSKASLMVFKSIFAVKQQTACANIRTHARTLKWD